MARSMLLLAAVCATAPCGALAQEGASKSVFAKDNLVAWCIVPFDAKERGPAQRAAMLKRLGLRRLAYDWRREHVPTFEQEIVEMKKAGIAFHAFWNEHEGMFRLFEKHGLAPEIWKTAPSPKSGTQAQKVEAAAKRLMPLVERTRKLGGKLGLYNHGRWGGEPENLVAVCEWLRANAKADHVGIVYNFHHGHGHIDDFVKAFKRMQPYLLCVNLNGMNPGAQPKILGIGKGKHEGAMMKVILESGYRGPIGILGHRKELDVEVCLRENLDGLKTVLDQLGDKTARKTYEKK